MEETMIFLIYKVLYICFISLLFLKGAMSVVYTVGDEDGWDSEVDYSSWSNRHSFVVGDVLVFSYRKTVHNVYEVTEATFRSCDASSGVLATYDSGNDQIALKEVKKYWFICNLEGHCLGGMRFGIDVRDANSTNIPQTQPNSSTTFATQTWSIVLTFLVVFGILYEYLLL